MKEEQDLDIKINGQRKLAVFLMHFFCSGITPNISFFCPDEG